MDLYEKSMVTLQLPEVLEMLASEAVSDSAKEQCRSLRPADTLIEARKRQSETTAAKEMMVLKGSPGFSGIRDVRASLSRADLGGMLNTRELLDVAEVLRCARLAAAYGKGQSGRNSLDWLFRSLSGNAYLEERIFSAIPAPDEIADLASRELSDIRRKMRAASERVRDALQKIISSPAYAKALQDPIITTRSDRYVVPVKAERKGEVPGLVHDVSSSGATVFIEPMAAVKANNELRELKAKEKQEIERILMELSADCARFRDDISSDFTALTSLDSIFARAKLSYRLDCGEPEIGGPALRLKRARHPLLDQSKAVPIDVTLGEDYDTLVITGPNTGGKTVSLKTMGLLSVMALCGLHIPTSDGSCTPFYTKVLADIGDEQSIEQSLSTFSAHMSTIVRILEECGENTLLLFDELGAGTDPEEGAALAVSIIENARARGAVTAATTHYAELKVYATTQSGVQNAGCEFNLETLRPTYRLLTGVPGKSNAFEISRLLGLPEEIIEDARGRLSAETVRMEDVLTRLERQRQFLDAEKEETDRKLQEAETLRQEAGKLRDELSQRYEKADERARREARAILEEARREAEKVFEELDRIRKLESSENDHRRVNEARAALRRSLNTADERFRQGSDSLPEIEQEKAPDRPVAVGDTVRIPSMGVRATVLSVSGDGMLELQAGILKVNVRRDEVVLLSSNTGGAVNGSKKKKSGSVSSGGSKYSHTELRESAISSQIDLRGMETLEAIPVLEKYLDSAVMLRMESVTVIHGKGTGALRTAVQQALRRNKSVKSFRLGRYGEGETGVTVVELK